MKIGICGNVAFEMIAERLDAVFSGNDIVVGKTGAYKEELANPFGEFRSLDLCVLVLDWRAIVPDLYSFGYGDDPQRVTSGFRAEMDSLAELVKQYQTVSRARVFVFSPLWDHTGSTGFISRILTPSPFDLNISCQQIFNEACRQLTDVYPVDIESISSRIGTESALDAHSDYTGSQPFTPTMIAAITAHLAAMCVQFQKHPLKCIVLDLDNTLWGGVVGETGAEGIELGDFGPAKAYKDFQREIVRLHKQGVMIGVCSKNNTCDALEAMEQHPHMLIRPGMVSCFRINWDEKPKNMTEIALELNIGLDAIMFVDDSPAERELMRAALPAVEVLQMPEDPAYFAQTLRACTRFWPTAITATDGAKGAFSIEERLRNRSKELAQSVESFLLNSQIEVTIGKADQETMSRIAQLFAKTNQFNLTTRRYNQNELEAAIRDGQSHLFWMSMKDRFGDYGIISCALIRNNTIENFVLSCRAFGKQAERAFLSGILHLVRESGTVKIEAQYIPSSKNAMVKDFYERMGFAPAGSQNGVTKFAFELRNELPVCPKWIRICA